MAEYIWGDLVIDGYTDAFGNKIEAVKEQGERRERVTRCRDCIHWRMPSDREKARCTGAMAFVEPTPDGFCAWAKPREED